MGTELQLEQLGEGATFEQGGEDVGGMEQRQCSSGLQDWGSSEMSSSIARHCGPLRIVGVLEG